MPDETREHIASEYTEIYKAPSHQLYYKLLCKGGFSAIENFENPGYVQAYIDRCKYGAITIDWMDISNLFWRETASFHSTQACLQVHKLVNQGGEAANEALVNLTGSLPYWAYRIRKDIGNTLHELSRQAPDVYDSFLSKGDIHFYQASYDSLRSDGTKAELNEIAFYTVETYICSDGSMLASAHKGSMGGLASDRDKLPVSLMFVSKGNIKYYYPEEELDSLNTELPGVEVLEHLFSLATAPAILAFWNVLYTILTEEGSVFEFVPHLSTERMGHIMYESLLERKSPVPGIKAPQDGSLTDLIHTIASRIDLIPVRIEISK